MEEALIKAFEELPLLEASPKREPDPRDHIKGVNGYDFMSPYTPPTSTTIYKDLAEVMNNKGFHAVYPQSYTYVPNYFRQHGITPFFNPGEDSDYAKGSLTIAGMVELTSTGQPWALQRDQDIEVIIEIASQYLEIIRRYPNDPKLSAYAQKVHNFLKVMEHGRDKLYRRLGKLNPYKVDVGSLIKKMIRG